ncbi:MAG: hypothetical protein U0359_00250 [Byssovorax sp.]
MHLSVPRDAHEHFRAGEPVAAIRTWLAKGSCTQGDLAKAIDVRPSTLSAKMTGNFAWTHDELSRAYEWLAGHTYDPETKTDTVDLAVLLGTSYPYEEKGRTRYKFPDRSSSEVFPKDTTFRLGVVEQPPFCSVEEQRGELVGFGILPNLLRLILRRGQDIYPNLEYAKVTDLSVGGDLLRQNKYKMLLGFYQTPKRLQSARFIEAPWLRMPLNGVVYTEPLLRFVANSNPRWSTFDELSLPEKKRELENGAGLVGFRRKLFREARFIVFHGEVGHDFVLGHPDITISDNVIVLERYDASLGADSLHALRQERGLAVLLADDIMAAKVAEHLIRMGASDRITTLGVPRTEDIFAPYEKHGTQFHFNIGLPAMPVTLAISNQDPLVGDYLERVLSTIRDQDPLSLLDLYHGAFEREVKSAERSWPELVRYLMLEDIARAAKNVHVKFDLTPGLTDGSRATRESA